MPKDPKVKRAAMAVRDKLDRMLDREVTPPVRQLWDANSVSLVRQLQRGVRRGEPASAAHAAALRRKARPLLSGLYAEVVERMAESSAGVLAEGVHQIERYMGTLTGSAGPLADPEVVEQIRDRYAGRYAQARAVTAANLAVATEEAIRHRMARVAMGPAKVNDILDAIGETADQQWWQVERVIRTETSLAYSQGSAEAISVLQATEYPDLMKRWTELVSDETGKPLDKRVGADSIAMHGQVAAPDQQFVQPPGPGVPESMIGRRWYHPPNRPNDRSVLTPWRKEWGQKGWRWRAGRKIYL